MAQTITPEKLIFAPKITSISALDSLVTIVATKPQGDGKDTMDIFVHNALSLTTQQLTRGATDGKAMSPVLFSSSQYDDKPDHVIFLRSGKLWAMPLAGGESYVVWEERRPLQGFRICGVKEKMIIAEFAVNVHDKWPPAAKSDSSSPSGTGKLYDGLFVRYWNDWCDNSEHNHLVAGQLITKEDGCLAIETPSVDLMAGLEVDCPGTGPGHGTEDYAVSADGRYLAITTKRYDAATKKHPSDRAWQTDVPVYLADLRSVDLTLTPGSEKYQTLEFTPVTSADVLAGHCHPVFSPNSDKIAYLSMSRAQYESDRLHIEIYDINSKKTSVITHDVDLSFASLLWHASEPHVLYATAQYRGTSRVFKISLNEQDQSMVSLQVMLGDESRSCVTLVQGEEGVSYLYFLETTLLAPNQVKRVSLQNSDRLFIPFSAAAFVCSEDAEVSSLDSSLCYTVMNVHPEYENGDLLLPTQHQHYFTGANGDHVHCWYLEPLAVTETKDKSLHDADFYTERPSAPHSVPLLVIIHGGPQGAILNAWHYRWNLGVFASQGYAVVAINFHGSSGFGSNFQDSIRNDWGGKPFEDIMKGVDFVLDKYPYLNPKRVAALGASYGGYMINWLNGHTDRFACMVNHAGVFSLNSEYFSTEELWFPEWEFGLPWEVPETYTKWSPATFIENWKTPTLVIHGGKDFRVPETEGIAAFTALQRKGIPSKFLYFADECHWVLKPQNSLQWHQTIFSWLKDWLKKE